VVGGEGFGFAACRAVASAAVVSLLRKEGRGVQVRGDAPASAANSTFDRRALFEDGEIPAVDEELLA
jgi:hypothetical protein